MGEEERRRFDDEIVCRRPLATHFDPRGRFGASKLDLSRPNTSDTFFNAMDVVERAEYNVDVDGFSLDWESHSELGNPPGALEVHLTHRLTVVRSRWKMSRRSLVLLQLRLVTAFEPSFRPCTTAFAIQRFAASCSTVPFLQHRCLVRVAFIS